MDFIFKWVGFMVRNTWIKHDKRAQEEEGKRKEAEKVGREEAEEKGRGGRDKCDTRKAAFGHRRKETSVMYSQEQHWPKDPSPTTPSAVKLSPASKGSWLAPRHLAQQQPLCADGNYWDVTGRHSKQKAGLAGTEALVVREPAKDQKPQPQHVFS